MAVMFSAVACKSRGVSAHDLLSQAFGKIDQDSIDVSINANIKTKTAGVTVEIPMKYSIKATGIKENPVMDIEFSTTMMNTETKGSMYIKDKVSYVVSAEGAKYKMPLEESYGQSTEEIQKKIEEIVSKLNLDELKDVFTLEADDFTYEESEMDDETIVTTEISGGAIKKAIKNLANWGIDSIPALLTDEGVDMDDFDADEIQAQIDQALNALEISAIKINFVINKDGYLVAYKIDMKISVDPSKIDLGDDMDLTAAGLEATTVEISLKIKINNPGEEVVIKAPNLDEYVTYEEYMDSMTSDYDFDYDFEDDFNFDF